MKNLKLFGEYISTDSDSILIESEYIIKAGDTLSKIAKKYGTTVKELAKLNSIQNVDLINTGDTIQVPSKKSEALPGKSDSKAQKSSVQSKPASEVQKGEDYLLFNGNFLQFIEGGKVVKKWKAVSGRTYYHWYVKPEIWRKRYTISPDEWSKVKQEGPVPPGRYMLGQTQYRPGGSDWRSNKEYVKIAIAKTTVSDLPGSPVKDTEGHEFAQSTPSSKIAWGEYRWRLNPIKGTNTHGRGDFYLHGGSTPGSIGCIDLVTESGDFAKFYELYRKRTGKSTILVVVDYKTFDARIPIEVDSQPYKMSAVNIIDPSKWYDLTDKDIVDSFKSQKIQIDPSILKNRRSERV